MKKIVFSVLLFYVISSSCFTQTRNISVTIDDLPVVSTRFRTMDFYKYVTENILSALRRNEVQATGFVIGSKLMTDKKVDIEKVKLLNMWLESGMELGNHTFRHKDYNKVDFNEMADDVIEGEKILSKVLEKYKKKIKYFRHPMLHRGNNKEKADSLEKFLKEKNYIEAAVSVDNADYIYAVAYDSAIVLRDSVLMENIGKSYIDYMVKKIKYFEQQSIDLLGYNINHILLMHANSINADYLDGLIKQIKKEGYSFISLDSALTDKAYKLEDKFYKKAGISWIHRWAFTHGKTKEFYKDEPTVPEFITKIAGMKE